MAVVQKQTRHCILTAFVRSHIASNMQVIILKEASPAGFLSADEELWAIGVGSCISHGHNARSRVLQSEVLICKLVAVDGLSTGSIVIREIPTLESRNSDSALINKLNGLMRRYLKKTKKTQTHNPDKLELQKEQARPGTWTLGWHGGSQNPCSQNPSLRCTGLWSSLHRRCQQETFVFKSNV